MKYLDIESWNRKEHFKFFSQYDEPQFGVTVQVDCSVGYDLAKSMGVSFFLYYLHKALKASNAVEEFKYRIDDDGRVEVHETIHAASTIDRDNGTFGFSVLPFHNSLKNFVQSALPIIEKVQKSTTLTPSANNQNVIYFSALPWLDFTSLSHARNYSGNNSVPMISFGKVTEMMGKRTMPVSIHVHHALVDGRHVGEFVAQFQQFMNGR